MVWAGVWYLGKTELHIWPKGTKVDSEEYCKMLHDEHIDVLCKQNNLTFMQDGATIHSSKNTSENLDYYGMDHSYQHPPASPDANPIEEVWHMLKARIIFNPLWTFKEFE